MKRQTRTSIFRTHSGSKRPRFTMGILPIHHLQNSQRPPRAAAEESEYALVRESASPMTRACCAPPKARAHGNVFLTSRRTPSFFFFLPFLKGSTMFIDMHAAFTELFREEKPSSVWNCASVLFYFVSLLRTSTPMFRIQYSTLL